MTDTDLKQNVEKALECEPSVDASDIAVAVDAGVATLRGNVASYTEKLSAERVVLATFGVKAVANDLVVHLTHVLKRTDTEIAHAAVNSLAWHPLIPKNCITVTVTNGWLELHGTVDGQDQRDAAVRAVRNLTGVTGLTNKLVVKSRVKATEVQAQVEAAFRRKAEVDDRQAIVP